METFTDLKRNLLYLHMNISELETYFATAELPETISIKQGERITDVRAFVTSHLEIVRRHGTQGAFSAFHERLYLLWEKLNHEDQNDN